MSSGPKMGLGRNRRGLEVKYLLAMIFLSLLSASTSLALFLASEVLWGREVAGVPRSGLEKVPLRTLGGPGFVP